MSNGRTSSEILWARLNGEPIQPVHIQVEDPSKPVDPRTVETVEQIGRGYAEAERRQREADASGRKEFAARVAKLKREGARFPEQTAREELDREARARAWENRQRSVHAAMAFNSEQVLREAEERASRPPTAADATVPPGTPYVGVNGGITEPRNRATEIAVARMLGSEEVF
ncbi:hypothetical protein [Streptomyces sp. NPDC057250]|uniref:hypothetical protein n=1 Tax=Streptomyces sp. NPDC057250 TaxID=3346068 RepID=UPI0036355C83